MNTNPMNETWKERATASEHNFAVLLGENKELIEALQGWMMDHGHRCRVCMDRSQRVLKNAGRHDCVHNEQ